MVTRDNLRIGLALSGGGMRAATFHAGVLARLAAEDLLERVRMVSTVSGGSLLVGLVFARSGLRWPSSEAFTRSVLPDVQRRFTHIHLQRALWWRTVTQPQALLGGRAHLVSGLVREKWGIDGLVRDLPQPDDRQQPRWIINATDYESGRSWQFHPHRMGSYGRPQVPNPPVPIADALAASAAFPGLVSFLTLRARDYTGWFRFKEGSTTEREPAEPDAHEFNLWDGGVYDNLGVEPLFKDVREAKAEADADEVRRYRPQYNFLIVSDASGKLGWARPRNPLTYGKRLVDVARDQNRGLRARMIVSSLRDHPGTGAYVEVGNSAAYICRQAKLGAEAVGRLTAGALSDHDVDRAARFSTTLRRLRPHEFERLFDHGWDAANCTLVAYAPHLFEHRARPTSRPWTRDGF